MSASVNSTLASGRGRHPHENSNARGGRAVRGERCEVMTAATVLLEGLGFGEGPRWHDGKLWFSDCYRRAVYTVDLDGTETKIVDVPQQPSGLGWL